MSLEFRKIAVDVVDHDARIDPEDTWVWAKVRLRFEDETERFPGVTVTVATSNDDNQTLSAFRENAVVAAKSVLEAALAALNSASYSELAAEHRKIDGGTPGVVSSTTFDGGTTTFDGGSTTFR